MKKSTFKKFLAMLLALVMVFSMTACMGDSDSDKKESKSEDSEEEVSGQEVTTADVLESDDMKYVLVYNPNIYNENAKKDKSALKTGYFGNQIDVDGDRADGMEEETNKIINTISQNDINANIPWDKINLEGNRADDTYYDYEEGDERKFYTFDSSMEGREITEFECVYVGEYCYIWSDGSVNNSDLEELGKEFDKNIYEEMVESFGTPRFVSEDGGKVNILFYPFYEAYYGYFYLFDLLATGEVTESEIKNYGVNTDHAIVNINSKLVNDYGPDEAYSTLAHEFQHLICATAMFSTVKGVKCGEWINEAMSGYIEEKLYSGSKEVSGHYKQFNSSERIRKGQSIYNFGTDVERSNFDIGVYGSVYLFTEYLAEISGDDVFSNFHEYWRESYSKTLCDSEALINSVSKDAKNRVNKLISYPSDLSFDNENDEWMSKLILDFYLTMLSKDCEIKNFDNIKHQKLIYDELDGTNIEGGGRIILRVKKGEFEIPEDADEGFIYVGLDSDFNPVTDFIYK